MGNQKTLSMVVLGVGCVAVLFHIIGIATNSWVVISVNNFGLWKSCSIYGCFSIPSATGRLEGARALCILGLLLAVAGLVVLVLRMVVASLAEHKTLQLLAPCLLIAAGILGLVGVILFCDGSVCGDFGGYSLGLAIVGCILYIVIGVIAAVLAKSSSVGAEK